MRRHVPKTGNLRPEPDDALDRASTEPWIAPGDLPGTAARCLATHQVGPVAVAGIAGLVGGQMESEQIHQLGSAHDPPGAPGLADPARRRTGRGSSGCRIAGRTRRREPPQRVAPRWGPPRSVLDVLYLDTKKAPKLHEPAQTCP